MDWIVENLPLIWSRTVPHIWISVAAIVCTLVLSVPLGKLANGLGRARGPVLSVLGTLYAIPSLALFLLLPLVVGGSIRSERNVIIALTVFGIAIMVRGVADGLRQVSPAALGAARALGHTDWQRFWRVELPIALPVVVSALRVTAVSTVSLVTVAGALGTPNLGLLFLDGFQRGIEAEIIAGILAVLVLAVVFDLVIMLIGRALTPWTRVRA